MQEESLPAEALIVLGHSKPHFLLHVHAILGGPSLNEGPVKEVPIICDIHTWLHLEPHKQLLALCIYLKRASSGLQFSAFTGPTYLISAELNQELLAC